MLKISNIIKRLYRLYTSMKTIKIVQDDHLTRKIPKLLIHYLTKNLSQDNRIQTYKENKLTKWMSTQSRETSL